MAVELDWVSLAIFNKNMQRKSLSFDFMSFVCIFQCIAWLQTLCCKSADMGHIHCKKLWNKSFRGANVSDNWTKYLNKIFENIFI